MWFYWTQKDLLHGIIYMVMSCKFSEKRGIYANLMADIMLSPSVDIDSLISIPYTHVYPIVTERPHVTWRTWNFAEHPLVWDKPIEHFLFASGSCQATNLDMSDIAMQRLHELMLCPQSMFSLLAFTAYITGKAGIPSRSTRLVWTIKNKPVAKPPFFPLVWEGNCLHLFTKWRCLMFSVSQYVPSTRGWSERLWTS